MAFYYKDMIVWQKAKRLTVLIYELTSSLPLEERFGLVSQMRRCSISIISNVAEGSRRRTQKDKNKFMTIAFGSASELEAQIDILKDLEFGKKLSYDTIDVLLNEVLRMLNKLTTHYLLKPWNNQF